MGYLQIAIGVLRSMVILVSLLLFTVFAASGFYANYSYMEYRDLVPKPAVVGLISGIRASFRSMHDPSDPNVSDECLAYLKRSKIAALVAVATSIVMITFILVVRAAGLFGVS
jgi:hypothetical protein